MTIHEAVTLLVLFVIAQVVLVKIYISFLRRLEDRIDARLRRQTEVEAELAVELSEAEQYHVRQSFQARNDLERGHAAEIYLTRAEVAQRSVRRFVQGEPIVTGVIDAEFEDDPRGGSPESKR